MRQANSDARTMKRSLDDLYSICLQSLNQVCQTPINPLQGFTFGKSAFSILGRAIGYSPPGRTGRTQKLNNWPQKRMLMVWMRLVGVELKNH